MEKEQIKNHFAKQANAYEELMVRIIPQYKEQHEIISSLIPVDIEQCRALDLGCGNGVLSELILRKLPHSFVTGFDLTDSMLEAYENKLSNYVGRYECKLGDFQTDSIGEGYDIIIAGLSLHHLNWEEREKFYQRLYSALNSNGIFISRDIIIDEDQAIRKDQYSYWKEFMKSQGEDFEFMYSKHMEKDYPMTLTDHFEWLRKAGFSRVACQWRLYNFAITTARK